MVIPLDFLRIILKQSSQIFVDNANLRLYIYQTRGHTSLPPQVLDSEGSMFLQQNGKRIYPSKPQDVYLFVTCLIDQFVPDAGVDTVRLLQREGIRVHFPLDQTCCGQPAYSSGFLDEARAVARSQLHLFPEPWPIVVPSGSCAAMMRHHYAKLFGGEPALSSKVMAFSERVFELTEFLVNVVKFDCKDCAESTSVALHTSCHARRELGIHESSEKLLRGLAQVSLIEHDRVEECCGFGGTFAVKHPKISSAITADKVESLQSTKANTVVSADCGCLLNISSAAEYQDRAVHSSSSQRFEHIASFLWRRTNSGGAA